MDAGMACGRDDNRNRHGRIGRGVIGVLTHGPALLMVRRAAGVARGGFWCFPGGHVEPGETPRDAIRRELAEELGIDTTPTKRLGSVRVPDADYILVVWRVCHVEGELRIAKDEIAEARWLTPPEIRTIHPGLRSNKRVLELLGV